MSKWIVVMEQDGEGCDYTIGCGIRWFEIDAASEEEAKAKAMEALDVGFDDPEEWDNCASSAYIDGDSALAAIKAYEVKQEVDLMPTLREFAARRDGEKRKWERAEKLRKLDKLKAELGVEE